MYEEEGQDISKSKEFETSAYKTTPGPPMQAREKVDEVHSHQRPTQLKENSHKLLSHVFSCERSHAWASEQKHFLRHASVGSWKSGLASAQNPTRVIIQEMQLNDLQSRNYISVQQLLALGPHPSLY